MTVRRLSAGPVLALVTLALSAGSARADIDPVSGDDVVALLKRVFDYPEATIVRAKEALTRAR